MVSDCSPFYSGCNENTLKDALFHSRQKTVLLCSCLKIRHQVILVILHILSLMVLGLCTRNKATEALKLKLLFISRLAMCCIVLGSFPREAYASSAVEVGNGCPFKNAYQYYFRACFCFAKRNISILFAGNNGVVFFSCCVMFGFGFPMINAPLDSL